MVRVGLTKVMLSEVPGGYEFVLHGVIQRVTYEDGLWRLVGDDLLFESFNEAMNHALESL